MEFTPGYYRNDDGVIVYASKLKRNDNCGLRVHYIKDGDSYHEDYEDFTREFRFEPDGEVLKQRQIESVSAEISALGETQITLNKQALAFMPHITASGEFAVDDTDNPDRAVTAFVGDPIVAKKEMSIFRNTVAKLKQNVTQKADALKVLIKDQQAIIAAKLGELTAGISGKVSELQEIVKKAEEAIWTINLYLGKDVEIIPLRTGTPAPKETPVSIRQLVLFMDEECALDADYGGIDARSIDSFDVWLMADAKNLQQVLPEMKGVVAIKPRKNVRDYNDPWVNQRMMAENHQTYFLIRNGDNLYRIWADFDVGHTLLPGEDEFLEVFYKEDHDWQTHKRVKKPITPGSKAYMAAMDSLDSKRRHYFRVALILQGLLDRTKILHPLPVEYLNIINPSDYHEYLNFIYDADTRHMLPDGRQRYDEWIAEVNKDICVGQRIMGFFSFSSVRDDGRWSRSKRIFPRSADLPSSLELHTIESRGDEPGSFHIYYKRTDKIWRRDYTSGEAKVRARCIIYHDDNFIMNFDSPNATVENMQYYIDNRLDRHKYADMIPLLQRAIVLKKKEDKEEHPFRLLIVGQIMRVYEVDRETAEAAVPELVKWWKLKNQTHRALLSNDKAALKDIVDEFNIRRKRSLERMAIEGDSLIHRLVDKIKSAEPNVVLISHKRGNEYAVYVAHNGQNVYVKEQVWCINRSSNCPEGDRIRLKESKEWKTVDTRWQRWKTLYQNERWASWITGPVTLGYLTDPERQQIVERTPDLVGGVIPLAIVLTRNVDIDKLVMYYCDMEAVLPDNNLITNTPGEPRIAGNKIEWKRNSRGKLEITPSSSYNVSHYCMSLDKPSWREHDNTIILREWNDNIEKIHRQQRLYKKYSKRHRTLCEIARCADSNVDSEARKLVVDDKYQEYLREYGDPELWDDHLKTLKISVKMNKTTQRRLELLIERGIDCNGMTLKQVFDNTDQLLATDRADKLADRKRRGHHYSWSDRDNDDEPEELLPEHCSIVVTHRPIPQSPLTILDDTDAG